MDVAKQLIIWIRTEVLYNLLLTETLFLRAARRYIYLDFYNKNPLKSKIIDNPDR